MMSSTNEEDPFLQVQADVQSTLLTTRPLFTSYLRISSLHPSTKPPSPELLEARKDLQTALESITEDLSDLRASIEAVQSDPYKYGLDTPEIARRRQFIQEVASEIEDYYEELAKAPNAVPSKGKLGGTKGSRVTSGNFQRQDSDPYASRGQGNKDDGDGDDINYNAAFEQQQQLQMMHEQDEQLSSVFRTVGNLRQQADDMGRELEEQGEMLDTMDNLADRVGGRLQTGLKTMGTVIRKNEDGLSSCCIAVLIFVLIILLILVLIL